MPNVELLELFVVKLRALGTVVQKHESFLASIKLIFLCDKIENFLSEFNFHNFLQTALQLTFGYLIIENLYF